MGADEYQAYLDRGEYEYHGGFFDVSPIVLEVPYDDWYLVSTATPGASRSNTRRSSIDANGFRACMPASPRARAFAARLSGWLLRVVTIIERRAARCRRHDRTIRPSRCAGSARVAA
jgi:hypothetical protein